MNNVRTLVVSAWWPECRALYSLLAGYEHVSVMHPSVPVTQDEIDWHEMRRCQDLPETGDHVEPATAQGNNAHNHLSVVSDKALLTCSDGAIGFCCTGIGSVRAASRVSAIVAALPCLEEIVFCGTAGVYSNIFPLESAHECLQVGYTDAALLSGDGYLPGLNALAEFLTQPHMLGPVTCISVPSITQSSTLAAALGQFGQIENLELYGVANAAQDFSIPWRAHLGIANDVGENAHQQWKNHHIKASLNAQDVVWKSLF